ncbi:MAG TPA: sterol desaturase family protein [Polyangiaceae bacterium]|jgi:sterol desaturase/sphingolipid hydroxylase (fatty acid hydroxylase superfamily)|nr:sterol desaturase family protein [Polyangiaceae bacterium]
MTLRVLSPILIVGSALLLIALERRFPYEPRQKLFREGFFTDLIGYGLIQSYFLGLLISGVILYVDHHTGWSRYRLVGDWPIPLQFLLFFVTHDFYIYWFHRLQHKSSVLWKIHEAHHSVDDVDWLSGTRSHVLEIIINQTIEFAPIALLGAAPEVAILKATVDAIWGMYIHSNLNVRAGRWQYVLNGPEMHRWHHARDLPIPGKNYGTKLAIWDWIFGTAHLPPEKPPRYGLDEPAYPKRGFFAYVQQHVYSVPFFARRAAAQLAATELPAATISED